MMGTVYLIHLDRPLAHARHYIGWAHGGIEAVARRLDRHRVGRGSRLLAACAKKGIGFDVVKTWSGVDRHFERKLKKRNSTPRICPVCCAAGQTPLRDRKGHPGRGPIDDTRHCKLCDRDVPVGEFRTWHGPNDTLVIDSWCKPCRKAYDAQRFKDRRAA